MKAAVLKRPDELVIEEVAYPQVKPGYVVVNVKSTAICGTDVGIYKGKVPVDLPRILGHESTGQVVEVGSGVKKFAVGDRVVLNPITFCGRCSYCYEGLTQLCENGGLMGREVDGTFAEYVAVPESNVIKLPESISYEDGTSLIALSTVFRSLSRVKTIPGMSVAVIGLGPAGLLQTRVAKLFGANPLFAISRSDWKLEIAQRYGATVINASNLDPVEEIKRLTDGHGVDMVVECVGKSITLRQAMEMVRPGGKVLTFGISAPQMDNFYGYAMYYKELTLIGSRAANPKDFELAIKAVKDGHIDLSPIITHRYTLDQVKDALDFVYETPGKALRVVVKI